MKASIFTKIFTGYVVIIIIIAILLALISFPIIRRHYIDTLAEELENIVLALQLKIEPIVYSKQYAKLDNLAKKMGKKINTRITVIRPDGLVLADSERDPSEMENHHDRPEILEALNGRVGRSLRYSRTLQEYMLYIAIPVKHNDKTIAILRGSLPIWRINKLLHQLSENLSKGCWS